MPALQDYEKAVLSNSSRQKKDKVTPLLLILRNLYFLGQGPTPCVVGERSEIIGMKIICTVQAIWFFGEVCLSPS